MEEIYLGNLNHSMVIDWVCVYNNQQKLEEQLLGALRKQKLDDITLHIVLIDNISGVYTSMAAALNASLDRLQGEHVVFSHQDIIFRNDTSVIGMIQQINKLSHNYIGGGFGVCYPSRETIQTSSDPIEVDSVDECIFSMNTIDARNLRFNEALCDNWHMYAAEICVRARLQGMKVYVIDTDCIHLSPGVVSYAYTKTLRKFVSLYKKQIPYLWTTCAKIRSFRFVNLWSYAYFLRHKCIHLSRKLNMNKMQ